MNITNWNGIQAYYAKRYVIEYAEAIIYVQKVCFEVLDA